MRLPNIILFFYETFDRFIRWILVRGKKTKLKVKTLEFYVFQINFARCSYMLYIVGSRLVPIIGESNA